MDLHELLNVVCALYEQMPEEKKKQMERDQAISFAYGNVHLSNPDVTREMVELAYDELHSIGELR